MTRRRGLSGEDIELPTTTLYRSEDRLIPSPSGQGSRNDSAYDETVRHAHLKPLRWGNRFNGWRFTIFLAFITSLVVLSLNLGFLLYTTTHHRQENEKGVLYQGDCVKVQHMSTGFHLLVNILSTALLSASNFGMQCFSAPTRHNIDRAHQQGLWLDVGVPSVRNLFRVSRWRSILWLCLAFSSLPFHLVYNSTIFSTTSATAYNIFLGQGSLAQKDLSDLHIDTDDFNIRTSFEGLHASAQNGTLQHLDNTECVNSYAQTFQTTYNNLILVTDDVKGNDTYVFLTTQEVFNPFQHLMLAPPQADPYEWLCPNDIYADCSTYIPTVRAQIAHDNWTVSDGSYEPRTWKVRYCLAEKGRQHCKLQYSFPLIVLIIAFNSVKTCILCYMWLGIKDDPILTIGDAISSFLRRPDPYTQGRCLLTRGTADLLHQLSSGLPQKLPIHQPDEYIPKRRLWGSAASRRRWIFGISFWIVAIVGCIILLKYGVSQIKYGSNIWKAPLGEVNASTLIRGDSWPNSLIPIVIIANMPQLIFSFLYFATNSLLTAMNLAAEWSRYAIHRKGLRVSSNPTFSQRSYYFLSLPYRYALPLIAVSAILHWLISQSLFLVGVEAYTPNMKRDPKGDVVTCGYSPVAILCGIMVGGFMFCSLIVLSRRRFASTMPVAGSCSLAIAAACHPTYDPNRGEDLTHNEEAESEQEDEDMGLLPVKWGAIPLDGPVGHCSFTSRDVEAPEEGHKYQ
ncbi:hypothetical protein BDV59DRAFT_210270, partial [Aspergillus ambiguus]|uniref:uncharacterized protein n=1 Tax=Aspergillus ambiguus TaxID=176160 RepID=UPI003CCD5CA7